MRNHFEPFFGSETQIEAVKRGDVERFRDALLANDRLQRSSVLKAMTLLHGVFKRAKRRGWIDRNPCEDVERVTVKKSGKSQMLTPEEVMATARRTTCEQDAALVIVAAFTGLRMGELRALRWRDVDFANATVFVRGNYTHSELRTPKSGRSAQSR